MRWLIQLFRQSLVSTARRFHLSLQECQQTQQLVQQEICDRLIASEYGHCLGIDSLADWHRLPIVTYDDLTEWIERQKQTKISLLTPDPILFYEKTSGSRGPAKWIPYTQALRRSFSRMFCVWAYDLLRYGPPFSTGKVYFCVSPQLASSMAEAPVGFKDDSEYLDSWLRWLLRPFLVSPINLNQIQEPEQFKQQLSLTLLQAERLETISIWSPSFLKVQLDYIEAQRLQLQQQLRGRISRHRWQLLGEATIPWMQIWPELKLISCWDSANAADQATLLRSLFPQAMVQGKGLLATEAPITVPLIAAQGCVPLLDEVFLEFEDSQGQIYFLHELVLQAVYSVILSQKGGLYRYRLGDRVRVTHYYLDTPCLEFLGRDQQTSDLVGEKLHAEFVGQVLAGLPLKHAFYQSLVPVMQPQPHYVLLLDAVDGAVTAIAQQLDHALSQSYHYRHARLLGQLQPARVLVSQHIPEVISRYQMRSGKKWGDLKHEVLITRAIDRELLTELEQISRLWYRD